MYLLRNSKGYESNVNRSRDGPGSYVRFDLSRCSGVLIMCIGGMSARNSFTRLLVTQVDI